MKEVMCCAMDCDAAAKWEIFFSHAPSDCCKACAEHIGDLLRDDTAHTVQPITLSLGDSQ